MAKHIYIAHAADGTEFKRTSASRGEDAPYTHTVVYKHNFNLDLDRAGKITNTDASNFKYYTDIIARHGADSAEAARSVEVLAGAKTVTEYQFAKRDARVAAVLAARDNGAYDKWHNAGWCGRLDLAQKLAAQTTANYGNLEVTILEAVKIK